MQPPILPREDLSALGVRYRRIPVVVMGRDIYYDTRLILQKLEERFPQGRLGASSPDEKALEKLLEKWTIDAGIFAKSAQLIPTNMPLLKDERFKKDREDYTGRSWSDADMMKNRPEALAVTRDAFSFLESTLLADGREWILKTERPSLADIEGMYSEFRNWRILMLTDLLLQRCGLSIG
jgi:glutathione S-transferase